MSVKTLFTTEFPIFALAVPGNGLVVVAGGGGASKTGVPNSIVSLPASKLILFVGAMGLKH